MAEDASRGSPTSLPSSRPSVMMLGVEEERVKRYFKKGTRESYITVITYFHEIIRIHMSVETYTYHQDNSPNGTLMDGWRKPEDRIVKSQSRVISEYYV